MNLRLYSLFTDDMVLQRDHPIPLRGWSAPQAAVSIRLADHSATATAAPDGRWSITLPPMQAGGPHTITVTSGPEQITLNNIMLGDVWIASGQSNMDWVLHDTLHSSGFVAKAHHPDIRLLKLPRIPHPETPESIDARWRVCSPDSASDFSALAYHFGARLQPEIGVPLGLIDVARGGTVVHAWTPRDTLLADPEFAPIVQSYESSLPRHAELLAAHQKTLQAWSPPADPGNTKFSQGWADPALDDAAWPIMDLPCWWNRGNHDFSGVLWFRKTIDIPAGLDNVAGHDLTIHLGACDKSDVTYFNNIQIGGIPPDVPDCWRTPRVYTIPARLVRPGRNVIAVRAFSNVNQAGLTGPAAVMRIEGPGWSLPLAGPWHFQVEHNFGRVIPPQAPPGPGIYDSPYILFNSLIAPILDFHISGAIWYQGESDEYTPGRYRRLFPAMIRGWRAAWKQPFPFLFVQLPNFGPERPSQTLWAKLRDAQTAALAEPHTAMVPTIDIGDPNDLHPANKPEVGRRLALAALAIAYARKDPSLLSPIAQSASVHSGRVRVLISQADLRVNGPTPEGFEIAGPGGAFLPASARLHISEIEIWNDSIPAPAAVRYAWSDNPRCNITNSAALPLAPFHFALTQ